MSRTIDVDALMNPTPDVLWDRDALIGHLALHSLVPLRSPPPNAAVGVGDADDKARTVMIYRNVHSHPCVRQRSDNWTVMEWTELQDSELRKAYSLLVRAEMLPRVHREQG